MGSLVTSFTKSQFQTYVVKSQKWSTIIPFPILIDHKQINFDVASCQFAVHYMFQSREKACYFFHQVQEQLASNGIIVLTTIDSRVISDLILKEMTQYQQNTTNNKKFLRIYSNTINQPNGNEEVKEGQGLCSPLFTFF